MLKLTILGDEVFDEETSEFSTVGDVTIEFEHSLLSLSKWESKYEKPFLTNQSKTVEETSYYIQCMVMTPDLPLDALYRMTNDDLKKVNEYIESAQTATTFGNMPERKGPGETITSELIYYWMVAFNIPFECETWHLNRLFSLVRVCHMKNSKPKKLSRGEIARRNAEINAQRRANLNTTG